MGDNFPTNDGEAQGAVAQGRGLQCARCAIYTHHALSTSPTSCTAPDLINVAQQIGGILINPDCARTFKLILAVPSR